MALPMMGEAPDKGTRASAVSRAIAVSLLAGVLVFPMSACARAGACPEADVACRCSRCAHDRSDPCSRLLAREGKCSCLRSGWR